MDLFILQFVELLFVDVKLVGTLLIVELHILIFECDLLVC